MDKSWAESVAWFVIIPKDCTKLTQYLEQIGAVRVTPSTWAVPERRLPAGFDEPEMGLVDELWRFCDREDDVVLAIPAAAGWRYMDGKGNRFEGVLAPSRRRDGAGDERGAQ